MRKVPLQPAEAEAEAGKKKRKKLTPEEQRLIQLKKEMQAQANQNRLRSMPKKTKNDAVTFFSRWVTGWLSKHEFTLQQGPFSYTEMNGNAVKVLCTECYLAVWNGDWKWPENRKLSTQMIQVAKSKMGHIIRDYTERNRPTMLMTGEMTPNQFNEMEEAARQLSIEFNMREEGFTTAKHLVGDNALFLLYLEALYDADCYDLIAVKMHMEVDEVLRVEEKLLKFLEKKLNKEPELRKAVFKSNNV